MADYVTLELRKPRGWMWPEESFGLDRIYGAGRWCSVCYRPRSGVEQVGPIVVASRGFSAPVDAWVPNWSAEICLSVEHAERCRELVPDVQFRPIEWHVKEPFPAVQLVFEQDTRPWFDPAVLKVNAERTSYTGTAGTHCRECGQWTWQPLMFPPLDIRPGALVPKPGQEVPPLEVHFDGHGPAVRSPEWFGGAPYRQQVFRRDLAELLYSKGRDFRKIMELHYQVS